MTSPTPPKPALWKKILAGAAIFISICGFIAALTPNSIRDGLSSFFLALAFLLPGARYFYQLKNNVSTKWSRIAIASVTLIVLCAITAPSQSRSDDDNTPTTSTTPSSSSVASSTTSSSPSTPSSTTSSSTPTKPASTQKPAPVEPPTETTAQQPQQLVPAPMAPANTGQEQHAPQTQNSNSGGTVNNGGDSLGSDGLAHPGAYCDVPGTTAQSDRNGRTLTCQTARYGCLRWKR